MYEFFEFIIHVMVLHCGVLNLVSQFVGTVVGDDEVTLCVHVVAVFYSVLIFLVFSFFSFNIYFIITL